jgi:hypothetical protein
MVMDGGMVINGVMKNVYRERMRSENVSTPSINLILITSPFDRCIGTVTTRPLSNVAFLPPPDCDRTMVSV